MEQAGKIHEAIAAIMDDVGGVGKTRTNPQQGYKYRGVADVTLACQPVMARHKVHVSPHSVLSETADYIETKSGSKMLHVRQTIEYRFYHADGSYVPCVVTGEAMDSGDKTSNKVMSAALKYALTQVFCIPEADPDADTESQSPERAAERAPAPTAKPAPEMKPVFSNPDAPASEAQKKAIHTILGKMGITDREDQLAHMNRVLAPVDPITTVAALTKGEASTLIEALGKERKL